jgi:tight adherence protein C
MLLLIFAGLSLGAAVFIVGELATLPSRERRSSLQRAAEYGRVRVAGTQSARFSERVVVPAMQRFERIALRLNPRVTVEMISKRLLAAGLGGRITAQQFLAAKVALAIGGSLVGVFAGGLAGVTAAFALALTLAAIGFVIPGMFVGSRTRRRREELRIQLPDALDLLAVSVEAGLGFDGAVTKLTEHMDGALTDEFSVTLGEMRIGESRQEALKKLAERSAAPEVAAFCRAIVQADQLGISLGRILRVQAIDTRNRRQAAAEEKAMKAPIKMLFPTVIFIFPAMFIVVLGPAMLNLTQVFGS